MDRQSQTSFLNQCISLFMVTLKVFFFFFKPYGQIQSQHFGLKIEEKYDHAE